MLTHSFNDLQIDTPIRNAKTHFQSLKCCKNGHQAQFHIGNALFYLFKGIKMCLIEEKKEPIQWGSSEENYCNKKWCFQ